MIGVRGATKSLRLLELLAPGESEDAPHPTCISRGVEALVAAYIKSPSLVRTVSISRVE